MAVMTVTTPDKTASVAAELSSGVLVSRKRVEAEIDTMLATIRDFWRMEPDEVFQISSAMTARCTELAIHLHRLESHREWKQIRTMQVRELLDELDRQFRLHSRLVEMRRQDLESLRGVR